MKKKDLKVFEEFAHQYSQRFVYCFCATTGDGYPIVFTKSHYGRFLDYLDEKYHIEIKPTDVEAYKIYERIMLDEIKIIIENHKAEAKRKEKEMKKKEKEKKAKGKK